MVSPRNAGQRDTIAAIATGPGEGAIAIVRVSGPGSLAAADRVFRGSGPPPSRRRAGSFAHGFVVEESGRAIDEVLLLVMRAPCSYTGEDAVEFQGHGGRVAASRVLARVLAAGCRLAEPGEFTQRAFLAGRLDLLQAEAVLDLVRARSDRAADAALEQLEGRSSGELESLYVEMCDLAAELEASLDFPDEDATTTPGGSVGSRLRLMGERALSVRARLAEGRVLREGLRVVIAGAPNAGKSTLFNGLLGFDRAIVSPTAGTTRDTLEEITCLDGIPVRLIDTAGIRTSDCPIERDGVLRTSRELRSADIVIHVVDSTSPLEDQNLAIAGSDATIMLIVFSKKDLRPNANMSQHNAQTISPESLMSPRGIEEVRAFLSSYLSRIPFDGFFRSPSSDRIAPALDSLSVQLRHAAEACARGSDSTPEVAARLRQGADAVGLLIGKTFTEDVLASVFSKFCIGK